VKAKPRLKAPPSRGKSATAPGHTKAPKTTPGG
jgi:hypothetical protein